MFTSNFSTPSPMNCKRDVPSNSEFFRRQWEDYDFATGLDKHDKNIRLATFRLNLKLSQEERSDISTMCDCTRVLFQPKKKCSV